MQLLISDCWTPQHRHWHSALHNGGQAIRADARVKPKPGAHIEHVHARRSPTRAVQHPMSHRARGTQAQPADITICHSSSPLLLLRPLSSNHSALQASTHQRILDAARNLTQRGQPKFTAKPIAFARLPYHRPVPCGSANFCH
eukprot:6465667-Amphidinium_carterae.1